MPLVKFPDFTLEAYRELLQTALTSGYRFAGFGDIGREAAPNSCLLRHDIDAELFGCEEMLAIEAELGVKATYFLMTRSTSYNLFCLEARDTVARLLRGGHEIGLHFMGEFHSHLGHAALEEKVLAESEWLEREFGARIAAISFHQPSRALLEDPGVFGRLVNTYNREQMGQYSYVSDTNMTWRHEHPAEIFARKLHKRLQLLIHPIWWTAAAIPVEQKWLAALRRNNIAVLDHWQKRERTLQGSDSHQTQQSFSDKWTRNPGLVVEQTLERNSHVQKWILERNGFASFEEAAAQLQRYSRFLDAGCGNGRVSMLLSKLVPAASILGVDRVDLAPARANAVGFANVTFETANLLEPLDRFGQFDFIYCQEVLHHTGDAEKGFRNLAEVLAPGGKLAIYVYRRKAPAREYMDDYVRSRISGLPYEQAMAVSRQIAALGRRLAQVEGELEVDDIPLLGIEKGRYTPQRLLYNFFLKCYWNDALSEEENAVVNYDWYHPQDCSRHTLDEVLSWFSAQGLEVTWQHEDLYGITVHGTRR